jgi:hypothetical protein
MSGTSLSSISPDFSDDLQRVGGELVDLAGRLLAALGQLAHLGGDHGKPLAVFAGARRLDGRVERQQVGLARNLLDDGDLVGDLLHRGHRFKHALAALLRVLGALVGDLVGLLRVVGVLLDVGDHLLHRRRGFFGRCRLRAGALRDLTEAVEMDWLAAGHLAGDRADIGDGLRQPATIDASACISLSCGERSRSVTVRLPLAISSAAAVMSFMATISVFRLFLMVLKSPL